MTMVRVLAHTIIHRGRSYRNHIAEIDPLTGEISLFPFERELPSTTFISGTVEIEAEATPDGRWQLKAISKPPALTPS